MLDRFASSSLPVLTDLISLPAAGVNSIRHRACIRDGERRRRRCWCWWMERGLRRGEEGRCPVRLEVVEGPRRSAGEEVEGGRGERGRGGGDTLSFLLALVDPRWSPALQRAAQPVKRRREEREGGEEVVMNEGSMTKGWGKGRRVRLRRRRGRDGGGEGGEGSGKDQVRME
eukprot:134373-Hanusia_phi.AAC.3